MEESITLRCEQHKDKFECPEVLIDYNPKFNEYGIIIHDGGTSSVSISHCPWCGAKLPESKRNRWFNELAALGYDDPLEQAIPQEYQSDTCWRKNE